MLICELVGTHMYKLYRSPLMNYVKKNKISSNGCSPQDSDVNSSVHLWSCSSWYEIFSIHLWMFPVTFTFDGLKWHTLDVNILLEFTCSWTSSYSAFSSSMKMGTAPVSMTTLVWRKVPEAMLVSAQAASNCWKHTQKDVNGLRNIFFKH